MGFSRFSGRFIVSKVREVLSLPMGCLLVGLIVFFLRGLILVWIVIVFFLIMVGVM